MAEGKAGRMPADEVLAGDVYTDDRGANWMVREARERQGVVLLLLSAGRTDPGTWGTFDPKQVVEVWRPAVHL